jgi:hypothetical protein
MKSLSSQSAESSPGLEVVPKDDLHLLLDLTIDKISLRTNRPDVLQDLREISLLCNTLEKNMPVWDAADAACEKAGEERPLVEFSETKSLRDCSILIRTVETPMTESRAKNAKVLAG